MGGEKFCCSCQTLLKQGSPPHGRGKAAFPSRQPYLFWITPAWAGKSPAGIQYPGRCRDHPRMGGEKPSVAVAMPGRAGSPPHGRGKVCISRVLRHRDRITPAWAGKRRPSKRPVVSGADYPRMGGEKCYDVIPRFGGVGSPPHGRGKGTANAWRNWLMGITPAWAGKSSSSMRVVQSSRDHPRMGGEKFLYHLESSFDLGSPPHGRGKARLRAVQVPTKRITPAWAGKSRFPRVLYFSHEDHPRMGGEKTKKIP